VVDQIGCLFGRASSVSVSERGDELGGFFADLLEAKIAICQQSLGIAARRLLGMPRGDFLREC